MTGPNTNRSYGVVAKVSYLVDKILSRDDVKFNYKVWLLVSHDSHVMLWLLYHMIVM